MPNSPQTPGIVAQRLSSEQVAQNFATYQPAYDAHEARVAADRCYFCHDAPCMTACPTAIDIPPVHPPNRHRHARCGGQDDLCAKHHGGHVRACLPDRDAV